MSMCNEAFERAVTVLDTDRVFKESTPEEQGKYIRMVVNFSPLGYSQKDRLLEALLSHYEVL